MNLAARGARQLTERVEKITDAVELRQVRRQALRVMLKSLLFAIPITALTLILPAR